MLIDVRYELSFYFLKHCYLDFGERRSTVWSTSSTLKMQLVFVACLVSACLGTFLVSGMKMSLDQDPNPQEEIDVRVVNGQNAIEHEIPWQVGVRYNGRPYCGGSILSKYWVLSAAHCFSKPRYMPVSSYQLHFGAHDSSGKTALEETRRIKKVFPHSVYSANHLREDFALILLDRPLEFNKAIQPIALPKAESRVPIGKKCLLSGWGYTDYKNRKFGGILQKTTLSIANEDHCTKTNDNIVKVDHKSMLCAGEIGKTGGCHGDSGGPLACNENGKWVLRGVVSWGKPGCSVSYYTVFARVSHAINWIQGKVKEVCKTA